MGMICSIVECERAAVSRQMCEKHYMRMYRTGDPLGLRRKPTDPGAQSKACLACGAVKPMSDFPATRHNRDGRTGTCRECYSLEKRRKYIWRTYGLTLHDYDAMSAAQGGGCAICGSTEPLVVDHCHSSGRVRALLCNPCNKMLGSARDDPRILAAGASYLLTTWE